MQLFKKVLNFSAERYLKTAGDLFIYHSDYFGALGQVEKALESDPNDTRALVLYGDILFCLNRDAEALTALNQALTLNSNLPEAYISKAGVLEVMGKYREALLCCKQAFEYIQLQKEYLLPSLFDQQLTLLIRLKRYREAQRLLEVIDTLLEQEDADYLQASYRGLIDQSCKRRRQKSVKSKSPLSVLNGGQVLPFS